MFPSPPTHYRQRCKLGVANADAPGDEAGDAAGDEAGEDDDETGDESAGAALPPMHWFMWDEPKPGERAYNARSRPLALAPPDVGSSMLVAETSTSELGIALVLPLIVYKLAATAMGYRLQPTLDFTIAGAVTVVVWLGLRESHIL